MQALVGASPAAVRIWGSRLAATEEATIVPDLNQLGFAAMGVRDNPHLDEIRASSGLGPRGRAEIRSK